MCTRLKPTPNSPAWMHIPASSVDRASAFYTSVFGWQVVEASKCKSSPSTFAAFTIPGSVLMAGIAMVGEAGEGGRGVERKGIAVYLLVEDVDAALVKVKDAGGEIISGKITEGGDTEMGMVRDTEGNRIGVLKWLI